MSFDAWIPVARAVAQLNTFTLDVFAESFRSSRTILKSRTSDFIQYSHPLHIHFVIKQFNTRVEAN